MNRGERPKGLQVLAALFTISPAQRRSIEELNNGQSGGFELVIAAVLFAMVGFFLDGVFGTRPILMLVFGLVGVAGAVYRLYYDYTARMKQAEEGKPWTR